MCWHRWSGARARRLERFLTQPFFTTGQFTGLAGKLVSRAEALDGCERILADEFKDLPESALYMIGAIDEATAKAGASKPASAARVRSVAIPSATQAPDAAMAEVGHAS